MNNIKSEDSAPAYTPGAQSEYITSEDKIIQAAGTILESRLKRIESPLICPSQTHDFLRMKLAGNQVEAFHMISLDNRNAVIKCETVAAGTIDGAAIYPREILKRAFESNAAAVIFAHNHPSGITEPSKADMRLCERLEKVLMLVNIRVLDFIIVGNDCFSFAEAGYMASNGVGS